VTSTTDTQSHIQGSPSFPQLAASLHQSSKQAIDRALADLQANKGSWVSLGPAHRIEILDEILPRLEALGGRWVASSLEAKSVRPGTFAEGEEWAASVPIVQCGNKALCPLVSTFFSQTSRKS